MHSRAITQTLQSPIPCALEGRHCSALGFSNPDNFRHCMNTCRNTLSWIYYAF